MEEDKLLKEISERQEKLDILKALKDKFPSLEKDTDRWGHERYYAKEINSETDQICIHHSCGCCPDAGLLARPYKNIMGVAIYSDPPRFNVGQGLYGGGDQPDDGWEKVMREALIPECLIEQVEKYFKDHDPAQYEEDEE